MPRTREQILEERRQLKAAYADLFDAITEILFRHDPIGINFEVNTDEYEAEARTILPRLRTCKSPADVTAVVHEEFSRWFSPEIAGSNESYSEIAAEIWYLWHLAYPKLVVCKIPTSET
jgi:hypothetical protein